MEFFDEQECRDYLREQSTQSLYVRLEALSGQHTQDDADAFRLTWDELIRRGEIDV